MGWFKKKKILEIPYQLNFNKESSEVIRALKMKHEIEGVNQRLTKEFHGGKCVKLPTLDIDTCDRLGIEFGSHLYQVLAMYVETEKQK